MDKHNMENHLIFIFKTFRFRSLIFFLCLPSATTTCILATEQIEIEVSETAGIRRFNHPTTMTFNLTESVSEETSFRLLDNGQPIEAQFRSEGSHRERLRWWLDFPTSLLPYETKRFTIEYGLDVPAGPERKSGHKLTQTDDAYQITNAPWITWTIRRNLQGLIHSVNYNRAEQLRPSSNGLMMIDRDGKPHPLYGENGSETVGRVLRDGPQAVGLQFETTSTKPGLRGVYSIVDLHFPVSRSWIEIDWRVVDPKGKADTLALELDLALDEPTSQSPTLVDFGAATLVYSVLRPGQQAALEGPSLVQDQDPSTSSKHMWSVSRGPANNLQPFVVAPLDSDRNAEGWAHIMDRQWCGALAMDGFGRHAQDHIRLSAEGHVSLQRSYDSQQNSSATNTEKRFRVWLHFIPFPPQHGAATSPQSMQNPLEVRVIDVTKR